MDRRGRQLLQSIVMCRAPAVAGAGALTPADAPKASVRSVAGGSKASMLDLIPDHPLDA
jgi:hypothetical protein